MNSDLNKNYSKIFSRTSFYRDDASRPILIKSMEAFVQQILCGIRDNL